MRRLLSLAFLLCLVWASALTALATSMSIAQEAIPYWGGKPPSGTIYLVLTVDTFTATDLITYQGGGTAGAWKRRIPCLITSTTLPSGEIVYTLTIPQITGLQSTVDAPIGTKDSRYHAEFQNAQGVRIAPYAGFESFRLPDSFATGTLGTWSDVRSYNLGPSQPIYDLSYYSRAETNRLIAEAVAGSSGLTMLNGLMGPHLDIVAGTNLTVTPAGTNITVGLGTNATAAVTHAGSATYTSNGVLYGSGAGAFGVTAQGPAFSILAANAGAPAFSQTPQINTSLTLGVASSQTGSEIFLNSTNANTVTLRAGITSASYPLIFPLAQGAAGSLVANDGSGNLSFTTTPSLGATSATSLTVSGLTSGRVPYISTGGLLADSSTFLWDNATGRLSLGTTLSTASVQIPNLGHYGGVATGGGSVINLIGTTRNSTDAVDVVAIGNGATRIGFDAPVFSNLANPPTTSDTTTAGSYGKLLYNGAVTPVGAAYALRATFDNTYSGSGNADVLTVVGSTAGTRNATALKALMGSSANGANVFGANIIVGADGTGTDTVNAIGIELNPVVLTNSTNNHAGGLYVANTGDATLTVPGAFGYYFKTGISVGDADSGAAIGWDIDSSIAPAILSNALHAGSAIIKVTGAITPTYGFDLAALDAQQAAIIFHNGDPIQSNTSGLSAVNLLQLTTGNYLEIGDGTGGGMLGMLFRDGTSEYGRIVASGSVNVPGNLAFGNFTTSPTYTFQETATPKRALTGTNFTINNGSAAVVATGSLFTTELAPGSSITFTSQVGTFYTVLSITDATHLTLTTTYSGSNSATATAKTDYAPFLIESAAGDPWLAVDQLHTVHIYNDTYFGDERGALAIHRRDDPTYKLLFGVDSVFGGSYISSIKSAPGGVWQPLFVQAGAGTSHTGGLVVGTSTPSSAGAMFKAQGGEVNPGQNHVGSEFNDLSTNTSGTAYQKILAQHLGSGAWYGPVFGDYLSPTGGTDTTTGDRLDIPLMAVAGKSGFMPVAAFVALPVVPTAPRATVEIYGYPTESATIGADTVQTFAATNVAGTGTTWNTVGAADRIQVGDAVMFGSDTRVYQVATVPTDTTATLTDSYAGTPTGSTEMWRDPYLLLLSNAYGTERFRVESNGKIVRGGASTQGGQVKTLTEGAATAFTTVWVPSNSYVGGYIEYTIIADDAVDYQARSGIIPFSIVNKAGTETATVGTVTTATEVVAASTGTLTNTMTADTTPTNGVSFAANATSSLAQTTLAVRYYVVITSSGTIGVSPLP